MIDPIYELGKPMLMTLKASDGSEASIDMAIAAEELATVQERVGTADLSVTAEHFRPWVAKQLGVDVDALSLGEVAEVMEVVAATEKRTGEERKKKLSTTLSLLFSTQESQETTETGPKPQKTPGSPTIPLAGSGEAEWTDP